MRCRSLHRPGNGPVELQWGRQVSIPRGPGHEPKSVVRTPASTRFEIRVDEPRQFGQGNFNAREVAVMSHTAIRNPSAQHGFGPLDLAQPALSSGNSTPGTGRQCSPLIHGSWRALISVLPKPAPAAEPEHSGSRLVTGCGLVSRWCRRQDGSVSASATWPFARTAPSCNEAAIRPIGPVKPRVHPARSRTGARRSKPPHDGCSDPAAEAKAYDPGSRTTRRSDCRGL